MQMVACYCGLLEAGMLFRLCCLYDAPSNAFSSLRRCCSSKTTAGLQKLSAWSGSDSYVAFFLSVFLYRPLFALFLSARITAGVMMSKPFDARRTPN